MGRKVHPLGFRIGVIRDWQAKWYADKHYLEFLQEDLKLRRAIQSRYAEAGISEVETDRQSNKVVVTIYTARPGIVIGRGGQRVDEMRQHLEDLIGKRVQLNILEIQQSELDAYLVARAVAEQIERRVAYRRVMKQSIFRTMQAGAKGVKIRCAGRLAGTEIARRETMHQGQVPLHTLRADIDYGFTEARTALGRIGVKVWIYKGDILPEPKMVEAEEEPAALAVGEGAVAEPEPTEELAEAVAEKGVEVAEPELAEAVAEKGVAPAPSVAVEEKPKKPVRKKKKVAAKEAVAVTSAEKPEKPVRKKKKVAAKEAVAVTSEEKPEKPVRKKKVAAKEAVAVTSEEKPEKPVRKKKVSAKEAAAVKSEEKPEKPTRRKKVTDTGPASVTAEGQDATTETS